jgi:hypothetical protein
MKISAEAEGLRAFVLWALEQQDLELFDAAKDFVRQLFIFAHMRFGGNEFRIQQRMMSELADKLMRVASLRGLGNVPISVHVLACASVENRRALDMAIEFAPAIYDLAGFPPREKLRDVAQLYFGADCQAPFAP